MQIFKQTKRENISDHYLAQFHSPTSSFDGDEKCDLSLKSYLTQNIPFKWKDKTVRTK